MSNKSDKMGKWTIHDVARVAGVSAKTVSRVVNAEAGVGEATRARIAQIISDVGYFPHTGARSMRSRTRDCIGVTVPAPVNVVPLSQSFFIWVFNTLYRIFGNRGSFITFDLNPYAGSPCIDYARGLWEQRYSGVVVCGPLAVNDTTIRRIHDSGSPYLAMGRLDGFPECSCATVDYELGTYLSTSFLIKRGHTKIAMLKGFEGFQPGVERQRGYLKALEEAGIEPCDRHVRSVTFESSSIVNMTYRLLLDPEVTALVDCSATEDGKSIREGARRAGRVPGKDFEVVSWTFTDNSAVLSEACAHVWLPVREAAAEGLELLSRWFDGETDEPIKVLYRPTLYERVENGEISKPQPLFDLHY